jgi:hypothetical protein
VVVEVEWELEALEQAAASSLLATELCTERVPRSSTERGALRSCTAIPHLRKDA